MITITMFPKSSALQEDDLPDEIVINQMFEVTHDAMTRIIPSDYSKQEGYKIWRESYENRIKNGTNYILIFEGEVLKGYLAFKQRYDKEDICIEDLIISPIYQGNGLTAVRLLHSFFKGIEHSNTSTIRAYTNKVNNRMQGLLFKTGFSVEEYTDRGIKLVTTKEQLLGRFSKLFLHFSKRDKSKREDDNNNG